MQMEDPIVHPAHQPILHLLPQERTKHRASFEKEIVQPHSPQNIRMDKRLQPQLMEQTQFRDMVGQLKVIAQQLTPAQLHRVSQLVEAIPPVWSLQLVM
jgi:hypothetical protein